MVRQILDSARTRLDHELDSGLTAFFYEMKENNQNDQILLCKDAYQ